MRIPTLALAAALLAPLTATIANDAAFAPDALKTAAYLRDLANGGSAAYDIVESLTTE
ncbi:MAG: aminopeptidase, partial [Gammaproteobacteria bacterium HGW-Gammaproteobacteria-5]